MHDPGLAMPIGEHALTGRLAWHRDCRVAPAPARLRESGPLSVFMQQTPDSARRAVEGVGNFAVGLALRPQRRGTLPASSRPPLVILASLSSPPLNGSR